MYLSVTLAYHSGKPTTHQTLCLSCSVPLPTIEPLVRPKPKTELIYITGSSITINDSGEQKKMKI